MSVVYQNWPRREEYDQAMKTWQQSLLDPQLRAGTLARDGAGIRRPGGAGLYVCSYRVDPWFVRCFCASQTQQPPPDIVERYRAIADFVQAHAATVPALVPITLLEQGIQVGQRALPLVKMPLVANGSALGRFIERNKSNGPVMAQLAGAWVKTMDELEQAPLAHGDLDLTNVIIQQVQSPQPGLLPRLIDYDDMWVPALAGRGQTEHGHEPFQHPAFLPPNTRPYTADMDRFSALVIYLGICALARRPGLYDEWGADDTYQWLIGQEDYRDPDRGDGKLAKIAKLSGLEPYVDELRLSLRQRRMPEALAALVARVGPAVSPSDAAPAAAGSSTGGSMNSGAALYGGGTLMPSGAFVPAPPSVPLDHARPPVATFGTATRTASAHPYPATGGGYNTSGPAGSSGAATPGTAGTPLYPASPRSAQQIGGYGYPQTQGASPFTPAAGRKSSSTGWVIAIMFIIVGLILLGILIASSAH